jgi:pimeloyl-ACP methyl ester carboxylesterase
VGERDCDVVVGFSLGATVALEMVASGVFPGPTVLLGISMSTKDEAVFFRAIVRLGSVLGRIPSAALLRMAGMMVQGLALPSDRKAELAADFRRNDPRVIRRLLREYVRYLGRHADSASRLCDVGVPAWIVHAEKGDGGLTTDERRIVEACPLATVVTIPGTSYLLPNEKQAQIAEIIAAAVAAIRPRHL